MIGITLKYSVISYPVSMLKISHVEGLTPPPFSPPLIISCREIPASWERLVDGGGGRGIRLSEVEQTHVIVCGQV